MTNNLMIGSYFAVCASQIGDHNAFIDQCITAIGSLIVEQSKSDGIVSFSIEKHNNNDNDDTRNNGNDCQFKETQSRKSFSVCR